MSSSAGQVPNTWSGTWINSAPDSTSWVFTQSGSGQSVDGVWKGSASSGTLSGTVQGSSLSGTLFNNEQNQSASFSITLAPDGHSFSGTFGSTGQWRSACYGGPCLSNTAPPAPPPVVPPGGGAPAAPTSPKLLAAATAWGQVGPATALEPGGAAVATSPPIAPSQRGASVTLSGDVSGETAIVFGTPKRRKNGAITGGDCVRAAVEHLKGALEPVSREGTADYDAEVEELAKDEGLVVWTTLFLRACLEYVTERDKQARPASLTPIARASRISCKLRAFPLSMRVNRAARTIHYRTPKPSRHKPARRLRGSCRKARDGTVTLRIRTTSRRVKLRKVLGPRLVLGLHRAASASGTANVQTTFKRR